MTLTALTPRLIAKPWGRRDLPAPYAAQGDQERGEPIGEVIFDDPEGAHAALLLKLLFTSEKLSVQVHPDDAAAQARGFPRGKDEAWLILDAAPEGCIAFGPTAPLTREGLRAAALDGSIENLLDWRAVRAGDVLYSPSGTIHAIGPGLSLVEVQQNLDLTYRLYDYGRPRELHLDDAVAVATLEPELPAAAPLAIAPGHARLAGGRAFQMEQLEGAVAGELTSPGVPIWLLPLAGQVSADGISLPPLTAHRLDGATSLSLDADARLIFAYPGASALPVWVRVG